MAAALGTSISGAGISTAITVSLPSTTGPGVIVACVLCDSGFVPIAPTASGLTFTLRQGPVVSTGSFKLSTFEAPFSGTFSGNVVCGHSDTGNNHYLEATVWSVTGTAGVHDANGSIPAYNTGTVSFTTSTANDFVHAHGVDANASNTQTAAGWTRINVGNGSVWQQVFYKIASGAGADSFQLDSGDNINGGCMVDALTPSAAAGASLVIGGMLGD